MIRLEAIKFNHDAGSAAQDALNLRRNASQFVEVPEWRRGFAVKPEDSLAAYAIAQTHGHTITIHVSLSSTDPNLAGAEVRAVDNVVYPGIVFVRQPEGCLAWLVNWFNTLFRLRYGNALGDVAARQVSFTNGQSGFVPFTLINTRLDDAPVGLRTTEWRWQYRLSAGDPWTNFEISRHRIYTILDLPTSPWQQAPYQSSNTQLPWADVLDYACAWAAGATTAVQAAEWVTRRVNELGPAVVTYDCPGGGYSWYSAVAFSCMEFLDRLRGGPGLGVYINCSDCATIVSTFANALGADLWQSRMGTGFFHLNPILAIGSSVWQPACHGSPGWSDGFGYHEVAWTGGCTANDNVYDACLQVDGDANPTTAPHTPLLPVNLRFGNPGDMQYRDRLATPPDRSNCAPLPNTRRRRAVV